jgi:hypothetical protein
MLIESVHRLRLLLAGRHKVQYIRRISQLRPRVRLRPVMHKPTSTANPQANRFCPGQLVICTVANVR